MAEKAKIFVIAGPTASGKSDLGLKLAMELNGEIVSADSMQLYRGLNIGVAKPTDDELAMVPHHLIGLYGFEQKIDVYRFLELANAAISDICARGRLPIIVGGAGFYLRALLYGLDELPGDAGLRAELDREYDHPTGHEELKKLMREKDPEAFARWAKHRRKLIRALEVLTLTGKSIAALQTMSQPELRYAATVWNLVWEREELKARIARRTEQMLASGWRAEAAAAIADGLFESPTARQALGYSIINEHLQGRISYEEMKNTIITRTWQFARRQLSWFRNRHPEAQAIAMPKQFPDLLSQAKIALF